MAEPVNTKEIVAELLDGLDHKSRPSGTVLTVKAAGKTVAEVCVGARAVRLNLRAAPPKGKVPKSITLGGHSKSWAGGGVIVTAANVAAARALLVAVTAGAPGAPASAADASAAARGRTRRARAAVASAGKGDKVPAAA